MLQKKNTFSHVRFSCESAKDLIQQNKKFHIIICSEVLEHVGSPQEYLRDFYRLLHPGGYLFVTVPNGYGSFENLNRLKNILKRVGIIYVSDHVLWIARVVKWKILKKGRPPLPGQARRIPNTEGYLKRRFGPHKFLSFEENIQIIFRGRVCHEKNPGGEPGFAAHLLIIGLDMFR